MNAFIYNQAISSNPNDSRVLTGNAFANTPQHTHHVASTITDMMRSAVDTL